MLKRVEPLRDELYSLERQAETNKLKGEEVKNLITQLERSIASYKEEYAQLISQAQAIKADLESVQAKVNRSIALLKSLVIERERWEATSETFKSQMSTIIGDVLLSSAFLAYAGYFDQHVSFKSLFAFYNVVNSYINIYNEACTYFSTVKTFSPRGVNIYIMRICNSGPISPERSTCPILTNV